MVREFGRERVGGGDVEEGKGWCMEFDMGYAILLSGLGWGFDDSLCSSIFRTFFVVIDVIREVISGYSTLWYEMGMGIILILHC